MQENINYGNGDWSTPGKWDPEVFERGHNYNYLSNIAVHFLYAWLDTYRYTCQLGSSIQKISKIISAYLKEVLELLSDYNLWERREGYFLVFKKA